MYDVSELLLAVQRAEVPGRSEFEITSLDHQLVEAIAQRLPAAEREAFRQGMQLDERSFVADMRWVGTERHPDATVNQLLDALIRLRRAQVTFSGAGHRERVDDAVRPVRVFVSSDALPILTSWPFSFARRTTTS